MNKHVPGDLTGGQKISSVRTFLFGGLAFVWFSEMLFMGFPSLARSHSQMWQVAIPENPQLETALYVCWSLSAPAKGALFIMAIVGLFSKNASTRTILFASSSLVPPLNMLFPFRQQGFLPGPMTVAATLSAILWISLLLIRERSPQPALSESENTTKSPPSSWQIFQYAWFACNAAVMTLVAIFFLFGTSSALYFIFPCLRDLMNENKGGLASPIHSTMAAGTHYFAIAIALWMATVKSRSNPTLRKAMTIASMVFAALIFIFPLQQLFTSFQENCADSMVTGFCVLLLAGWVIYSLVANKKKNII